MIFTSEKYITWDTWVYYYNGTYYAYYLITDRSPGEGFGVAISTDGVHFTDMGKCLSASDKMVFYLGTGAVWKSSRFDKYHTFICNYSEWRKDESGANVQNIFFAYSEDLINWRKYDESCVFAVDEKYYKKYELEGGRWDCVFPYIENGRYNGLFTATPKEYYGCGYAVSEDGVKWCAKKPPEFVISDKGITEGIELGAVCKYGEKYYLLIGTYVNKYGIAVLTGDTVNGKYVPQEKNFSLLSNRSFRHAYFMRFFEKDDELLVNHHCISRKENEYARPFTALSPFKKVVFDDEGILRLKWYEANVRLKGKKTDVPYKHGFIAEGILCKFTLFSDDGTETEFVTDLKNGTVSVYENGTLTERICKDIEFPAGKIRLLQRDGYVELYIDDWFVTCYTLKGDFSSFRSEGKATFYLMEL